MFGLGYDDWRLWLIIAGIITLLYVARPYLQRLLKSFFFGLAYYSNRLAMWLERAGEAVYTRYVEVIAAHTAEELEHKLIAQEQKLGRRAPEIDRRVSNVVDRLEDSKHRIEAAIETFREVDVDERTIDAVRTSMGETAGQKGGKARVSQAVTSVRQAVRDELSPLRPQLNALRAELKPLSENSEKLRTMTLEFERMSGTINTNLEKFETMISPDHLERREAAERQSILIPWLISGLVMLIALTGVFLNFFLIQRPMAEIVGDDMQVLGMSLPTAAAFVVIFLEAVAGIVLMDAAGITRLTPIHALQGLPKRVLLIAAICFLAAFSFFEAILAIQRESLIRLDQQTLEMALGTEEAGEAAAGGISLTMIAQMVLAILIPWLLAIAAIPLEIFVRNLVFILRLVVHQLLMVASFVFSMISSAFKALGAFLLRLYDLVIFLPLAIEQMVRSVRGQKPVAQPQQQPQPQARTRPEIVA